MSPHPHLGALDWNSCSRFLPKSVEKCCNLLRCIIGLLQNQANNRKTCFSESSKHLHFDLIESKSGHLNQLFHDDNDDNYILLINLCLPYTSRFPCVPIPLRKRKDTLICKGKGNGGRSSVRTCSRTDFWPVIVNITPGKQHDFIHI